MPCFSENDWLGLADQQLAGWVVDGHRQLTRAEAEWLRALAAFDRRVGYRSLGYRSCASWLARTTGMLVVTAREKVRMARALTSRLTQVGDALARGSISYTAAR